MKEFSVVMSYYKFDLGQILSRLLKKIYLLKICALNVVNYFMKYVSTLQFQWYTVLKELITIIYLTKQCIDIKRVN